MHRLPPVGFPRFSHTTAEIVSREWARSVSVQRDFCPITGYKEITNVVELPSVKHKPHHQKKHEQVCRKDAESLPALLRSRPPKPSRNESEQPVGDKHDDLKPIRPLGKWDDHSTNCSRIDSGGSPVTLSQPPDFGLRKSRRRSSQNPQKRTPSQ